MKIFMNALFLLKALHIIERWKINEMQLNGLCFKMCGGSIKSFSVAFKYFGAPTTVLHFPPG